MTLLEDDPEAVNLGNTEGRTCLHIAAMTNNKDLCKVLIDHGADVNAIMKNKVSRAGNIGLLVC